MEKLSASDFLDKVNTAPLLDVRSPAEFTAGHIIGAASFPLFSDSQRAIIGTLYKQEGRRPAIKKGLEITGPKMLEFIEKAESLGSEEMALYCWRGGMRSDSMAWLLERYGFKVNLLAGGYKAYRQELMRFFDQDLHLQVISGNTGSKKTALLHLLREKGQQVVDLEGLAKHQGSSFGNKKCDEEQPTTEQFQNLLFSEFRKMDLQQPIWIEDESMRVGRVNMMENLFQQKNRSPHFLVHADVAQRLQFLVEDYGQVPKAKLIEATEAISRKLGRKASQEAIDFIRAGRMKEAASIILPYYDARYKSSISRKEKLITARIEMDLDDLESAAAQLLKHSNDVIQVN